jgi:hypothetical protein
MSSIWTNLLFMHGHITNLELTRRLAETPDPEGKPKGKRQKVLKAPAPGRKPELAPVVVGREGCLTG